MLRVENKSKKEPEIQRIHRELGELEDKREKLLNRIAELEYDVKNSLDPVASNRSHYSEKIRLFRSLFKGREDVFPRRFESTKTGRTGYQPACENEWIPGICAKPRVKCAVCEQRELIPVSDSIIRNHLLGYDPDETSKRDFTVGVYPLLGNETCYFLAANLPKPTLARMKFATISKSIIQKKLGHFHQQDQIGFQESWNLFFQFN
ncbi:MAG: hypothetical protein KAK01_10935 [Candidatus Marinimicrobia bacterium]|nr:hypothetical protein [Candidatus Neomarinimicrobiota bacterium]